jgi:uncharacterized protein (TIGR00661 family)
LKNGSKINNISTFRRVLIAPLEWGLGHATRCIPIIKEFIDQNCEVFIAAEGATYSVLKGEFPTLTFLPVMDYRMRYSRNKFLLPLKIVMQFPKIIFTIYKEHQWLKKTVREFRIDAVISDNRFGLYHSGIPCVYITHQLLIKTGNTITEKIAKMIHYFFINKYSECWVPDFETNGLAGELSHPKKIRGNIKYLGAVSRFEIFETLKKYDLLISISGPEPQRTIFEKQLLKDLRSFRGSVLFVRGLPGNNEELQFPDPSVEIRNHLPAAELNTAMLQSAMIISRCGYTTIMDLVKLKKKAILIPTPGQPEQEYLARYLKGKKIFYTVDQKKFSLHQSLADAGSFPFAIPDHNMQQYKSVISEFVKSL